MNWNHVRTLRWLIAGFGLVAGLVLLAVGQGLIGGIMLVMAGLRIVMLLPMNRRMGAFPGGGGAGAGSSARIPGGGRVGGRRDEMLLRLSRNELDVAATAIGVPPDELRRAVDDGGTISAVAADAGIPTARVVDAIVRDASARVDRGVAAGNVAADRARTLQSRLPHWAERFVLSTPAMLAGTQPRA
jgi:hypothetical protein